MNRTPNVKLLHALMIVALPTAALLGGCAGRRPVAEMARAEQAVRHAQTTSEAQRLAPTELASAQAKLAAARREADDGDYDDARRLAEQALADAQLAEAKAESRAALEEAGRTRAGIQALQAEVAAPVTVVVERNRTIETTVPATTVQRTVRTTTGPATTVQRTVQTTAPPVVVERAVPTTVVVERPAAPAAVVIERDPAVVVIPE